MFFFNRREALSMIIIAPKVKVYYIEFIMLFYATIRLLSTRKRETHTGKPLVNECFAGQSHPSL